MQPSQGGDGESEFDEPEAMEEDELISDQEEVKVCVPLSPCSVRVLSYGVTLPGDRRSEQEKGYRGEAAEEAEEKSG